MSTIGPAFLHRPLPALSTSALHDAVQWLLEGIALVAPRRLREAGWRTEFALATAKPDGALSPSVIIERSWFGAQRQSALRPSLDSLPLVIDLNVRDLFETTADLPAAASKHLKQAISLRLDTLSPLPPEEIAFAVGKPTPRDGGRIAVPVAFARKERIDALLGSPDGGRIVQIGARADETGAQTFVFHHQKTAAANNRATLIGAACLAAGLALLLFGANWRLDRRIHSVAAYEDNLRAALHAENQTAKFLDDLPQALPPSVTPTDLAAQLDRLAATLPEPVWLNEISISGDRLTARGFSHEDAVWPNGANPVRAASDRPGIEQFDLTLSMAAGR